MVADRVNRLCRSVGDDPTLPATLVDAGMTAEQWTSIITAVRNGAAPRELAALLDLVDQAGAEVGVDGVTTGGRLFQPIPDAAAGFRTTHAWRCPHPHPCDHLQLGHQSTPPVCPLTGDTLNLVTVVSG